MSTILNNIPVYDPSVVKTSKGINDQSTQDLSKNFLQILITQLRNQDPMNPMDNAAMTSQLAQLNMVDGINSLNKSFSGMAAQMAMSNFMNLSGSVGKSAMVAGSVIPNYQGGTVNMGVNLASDASSVVIRMIDSQGRVVTESDFGAQAAGMMKFAWDGGAGDGTTVNPGLYRLEVTAKNANGASVNATSYVSGVVDSVGLNGSDVEVSFTDGRRALSKDIAQWVIN
jgi:flagellar basal-body rod modification protein FlgD